MERDSFIFYRSFYEAVRDLQKDIQLEVYTAIMEYALYGRQPEQLKPFARGIFTLIKPNIDVNTARFENGRKGGRKGRTAPSNAHPSNSPVPTAPDYSLTFEQEVDRMGADDEFRSVVCLDFSITPDDFDPILARFLRHCLDDKKSKGKSGHDSFVDAQSHLRYWISKAYPSTRQQPSAPPAAPKAASPKTPPRTSPLQEINRHNADYQRELEQTGAASGYELYLRSKGLPPETPAASLLSNQDE